MKFADYEIVHLPKAQWEGVPIPMRYTTEEYYAVPFWSSGLTEREIERMAPAFDMTYKR